MMETVLQHGLRGGIKPHATPNSGIVSAVSNVAPQNEDGGLVFVEAADALRLARPLPSAEEFAIDGLTDDEWDAFMRALASR